MLIGKRCKFKSQKWQNGILCTSVEEGVIVSGPLVDDHSACGDWLVLILLNDGSLCRMNTDCIKVIV